MYELATSDPHSAAENLLKFEWWCFITSIHEDKISCGAFMLQPAGWDRWLTQPPTEQQLSGA